MNIAPGIWIACGLFAIALTACQSGSPSAPQSIKSSKKPNDVIVSIARTAHKCWFKSGEAAFKAYRLANETNAYAGRPRFLLVPKSNPGGLPQLVVQAEKRGDSSSGSYTQIQTYGPLLETPNGKRITDDVKRWSGGNSTCKS